MVQQRGYRVPRPSVGEMSLKSFHYDFAVDFKHDFVDTIKDAMYNQNASTTQFWDETPEYGPDYSKGRTCRICSGRIVNKAKGEWCKACRLPIRNKARSVCDLVERLSKEKQLDTVILWRV